MEFIEDATKIKTYENIINDSNYIPIAIKYGQ